MFTFLRFNACISVFFHSCLIEKYNFTGSAFPLYLEISVLFFDFDFDFELNALLTDFEKSFTNCLSYDVLLLF